MKKKTLAWGFKVNGEILPEAHPTRKDARQYDGKPSTIIRVEIKEVKKNK